MDWDWIGKLQQLREAGRPVAMLTVCATAGSTPRELGARMLVLADGETFGTIGGGRLEQMALDDAKRCLRAERNERVRYPLGAKTGQCCGGVVELLVEVFNQGPRLYLFGAGHVGQAICSTLSGTPFAVHLIDERKEWIDSPSLPVDVIRHPCAWEDFVAEAPWDAQKTYVAILTHRHDTDEAILKNVLSRPTRYVGLIGSQAKWARFRYRLAGHGVSEEALGRVHCPMGLPLGGKAPQEVAISFAGEILQTYYAP